MWLMCRVFQVLLVMEYILCGITSVTCILQIFSSLCFFLPCALNATHKASGNSHLIYSSINIIKTYQRPFDQAISLYQWYLKWSPWTRNISFTWKSFTNANSWAPPQISWVRNSGVGLNNLFNKLCWWFWGTLQFVNPWIIPVCLRQAWIKEEDGSAREMRLSVY